MRPQAPPRRATGSTSIPYAAVPHALLGDHRLTPSAKMLAGIILRFARERDHAWPSLRTLGSLLNLGRRAIQLNLGHLKRAGWIGEEPAENRTGRVLVLLWRRTGVVPVDLPRVPAGSADLGPAAADLQARTVVATPPEAATAIDLPAAPDLTLIPLPSTTGPASLSPVEAIPCPDPVVACPSEPSVMTPDDHLVGVAQVVAPGGAQCSAPPPASVIAPERVVIESKASKETRCDQIGSRPRKAPLATLPGLTAILEVQDDPILRRELTRLGTRATPPPPPPTTIRELIDRVRERPHHPMLLANWLAATLNDRRSYHGYLAKVQRVVAGVLPPEALADALRQATRPEVRRPGALFMTALRRWEGGEGSDPRGGADQPSQGHSVSSLLSSRFSV